MAAQNQYQSTTQKFLDIYDVTNNLVILKNGTVSFVLAVSAMNFGLLAEAEQDAVIYTYAALLNSLNYPIQIIIQSQTKDATNYLNLLKQQEQKASTDNKKERIAQYRHFVTNLIKERNVLDKKFYCIVPATATELGLMTVDSVIPGKTEFDITKYEKSLILEKAVSVLEPRRDHLVSQFARIGLFARQLTTQEIIRIFYTNYNPEASEGQEIADTSQYSTPLVRANLIKQTQEILAQAQAQPAVSPQPTSQEAAASPLQQIPIEQSTNAEPATPRQDPTLPTTPAEADVSLNDQISSATPQPESAAVNQSAVSPLPPEPTKADQLPTQNFAQAKTQSSNLNFKESIDDFGLDSIPTNPTPPQPATNQAQSTPTNPTPTASAKAGADLEINASTAPQNPAADPANKHIPTPSFTSVSSPPTSIKSDKEKTQSSPSASTAIKNLKPPASSTVTADAKPKSVQVDTQADNLQNTINQTLKEVGPVDVYNKKATQPTQAAPPTQTATTTPTTPSAAAANDQNLPPIAEIT
jgi:hypothetical protein